MRNLWFVIPFGIFMAWGLVGFFRGGGKPTGDRRSSDSSTIDGSDIHNF